MAPEVAIAAETPQIDTALEIIIVNSLSTFNFLHNQKAKYHTDNTTTNDCNKPFEPASNISEKITVVPNSTSPILTNSSVDSDDLNHSGSLKKLPMINPIVKLKITASRFNALT
ncbi:hypothetical protein D3C87_1548610 [compost metagenome]